MTSQIILSAEKFYDLDNSKQVSVSSSKNLTLISIQAGVSAFSQKRIRQSPSCHYVSTHFNFFLNDASFCDEKHILQHIQDLMNSPQDLGKIPPPVAMVLHEKELGTISLANDFAGSAKVYCYEKAECVIYSNRAEVISFALGKQLPKNDNAWMQQAYRDWIIDDQCYDAELSMLEPGQTVVLSHDKVTKKETHSFRNFLGQSGSELKFAQNVIDETLEFLCGAIQISGTQVDKVGLTGGRDSRLIAALLRSVDHTFQFRTGYPPELEAVIAEQLVSASRIPMTWEKVERIAADHRAKTSFHDRAWSWYFSTGGDTWPSLVRNDFSERVSSVPLSINGGGGEVLRANFYNKIDEAEQIAFVENFAARKSPARHFLTEETQKVGRAAISKIIDLGRDIGLKGPHLLDWYYLRSQQRRRVPIAYKAATIFPLYTKDLVSQAFLKNPAEKMNAKFQKELTDKLAPEWAEIPYFAEMSKTMASSETDKTKVKPYYWEQGDRDKLLSVLESGLKVSKGVYVSDLFDKYTKIERSDPSAKILQSLADRIIWRAGYEENRLKVQQAIKFAKTAGSAPRYLRVF